MRIARDININNEKLSIGFFTALEIARALKAEEEEGIMDLSTTRFVNPIFVVSLAVFVNGWKIKCLMDNATSYLNNIHMTSWGIDAGHFHGNFEAFMKDYEGKSYMPLVCFPVNNSRMSERNTTLSTVESIIARQSKLSSNVINGLKYMFGEVTDNMTTHSGSDIGYVFAQCYPNRGFMDICMADIGVTLLGSFRSYGKHNIENDIEAMRAANRGISTKNLPDAENRGYGIHTTQRMLVEGLKGQYIMISGAAIYYNVPNATGYFGLPQSDSLPGTLIAMRLPLSENKEFRYIDYLE